MQEFKQYLTAELNKLDGALNDPLKIKVSNVYGHTNWITLPGITTAQLLELLTKGTK